MTRTSRYCLLTILMAVLAVAAKAQSINRLILPDVAVQTGPSQIPVSIENDDPIVAAQFDLTLPAGVTAGQTAVMTSRSDGHVMAVRPLDGSRYRVMLYSAENRPLLGQSGVVAYIPIVVPSSVEEGSEHQLVVTDAVLSDLSADNVLTESVAGQLRVSRLPDLVVRNVAVNSLTVTPGEPFAASWEVENVGELGTAGGWSEQLSLVSADGKTVRPLATVYYGDSLAAKAAISRKATVTVPMFLGIDGPAHLQVRVVPGEKAGESPSAQANNTLLGEEVLTVEKRLTLSFSPVRIIENETPRIAATLNRSGLWTEAQAFPMTATADSRLSVPSEVVIPAGQSGIVFYMQVSDNSLLDTDSVVTVTVAGHGYDPVSASVTIEDDEHPSLTLAASATDLNEGDTFQLTVTLSRASDTPVTVQLACEDGKRFDFPTQITIPGGALSTTVDVKVIDDEEVTTMLTTAFKASAEGYEDSGEAVVMLADNDMPELQLTVTPVTVSESAGIGAVMGVLRRAGNLNSIVTIRLSDDSGGQLYYPSATLTMKKGESEARFSLGIVDDVLVNGNREVHLSAAVYVASCNCYSSGQMAGNVMQVITILDDDSPALRLTPSASAFLEGSTGNSITIERNADLDKDLTVSLRSDYDEMLTYEHTVVIPAGQAKMVVPVTVASNDSENDDKVFTFTATAKGFTQGTCWAMVSDQNLPDAVVASFSVSNQEAVAGDSIRLSATIRNTGNNFLRKGTGVSFCFSDGARQKVTIPERLYPGDSISISTSYILPKKTGTYVFYVEVNDSRNVRELLYTNNVSERVSITLKPAYETAISLDKTSYGQGETIVVNGRAEGAAGKNATVEVYFVCDGVRQAIKVTTDSEGCFTASWKPQDGLSGHYIVGACYPGDRGISQEASTDVYGLTLRNYYSTCYVYGNEPQKGVITIYNPGTLRQTGIRAVRTDNGAQPCDISFDCPHEINPMGQTDITYTITGKTLSEGDEWLTLPIVITTDEGALLHYKLYYYVYPLQPKLEATQSSINTTMTYGDVRQYPVTITNQGKGATGKITLALPEWIQSLTPREMASLELGDSATIVLRFTTTEEMKLNVPVRGQIGINCENGDGLALPFTLTPVSDRTGTLTVDVVDEYTFYTDEKPHVEGAYVALKSLTTGDVVAEDYTREGGKCTMAQLPEGWYTLYVEADHHESYTDRVLIDPGKNKREEVFVSRQNVSYSWVVDETELEDEYSVETVATYDTRVPKPIVIIDFPEVVLEPNAIVPITLTNEGLISAVNVFVSFAISHDYEVEFVNDPSLSVLAPQQSSVFYARIKAVEENASRTQKASSNAGKRCYTVISKAVYQQLCDKYKGDQFVRKIRQLGKRGCDPSSNDGGNGYSGGSGGGGGYGGGGGGGGGRPSPPKKPEEESYQIYDDDPNPARYCKWAEEEEEEYDEVPDEEPEEADECDGENGPYFDFKFVPAEGTRYVMNSIVADGESKVKIVLDPRTSKIPKEECEYGGYHWTIAFNNNERFGKLSNEYSLDNVVYEAPAQFPEDVEGNSVSVRIDLSYMYEKVEHKQSVHIHLLRLPFNFCLADAKGKYDKENPLRGVAADGASIVKIIINPEYEKIPYQEFGYSDFRWEIDEKNGSFARGNSVEDFFVAPEDYPQVVSGETTVQAVFHYSKNGKEQPGIPFDIVLARVPVVLLHGLGGNEGTWAKFKNKYDWMYAPNQILNKEYRDSNFASFESNSDVVQERIEIAIGEYKKNGIIATKADLVGHSMGGILARLHVQNGHGDNVHKIITLNTPHSGSEWGDFLKYSLDNILGDGIIDVLINQYGFKGEIKTMAKKTIKNVLSFVIKNVFDCNEWTPSHLLSDAIRELGVNSPAIDNQLNGASRSKLSDIPVWAISTQSDYSFIPYWVSEIVRYIGLGCSVGSFKPAYLIKTVGVTDEFRYHLSNDDDLDNRDEYGSDQIVSLRSQRGGFSARECDSPYKHWHCGSASDDGIMEIVKEKLTSPVEYLHRNGFHPHNIEMETVKKTDVGWLLHILGIDKDPLYPRLSRVKHNSELTHHLNISLDGDELQGSITTSDDERISSIVTFVETDYDIQSFSTKEFAYPVPSTYAGRISVFSYIMDDDSGIYADSAFVDIASSRAAPQSISCNNRILALVNEELKTVLTCHWDDGSETTVVPDDITFEHPIAIFENGSLFAKEAGETTMTLHYKGLSCSSQLVIYATADAEDDPDTSPNICSSISLSFKQSAVMTRQAFRGTLKVRNDSEGATMRDVKVNLEVRNSQGQLMTSREFQISAESIKGFTGELDLQAGWSLPSGTQGIATVLFIPTKHAAPTEEQDYSFGGSFSYTDPATGMAVKHDLNPVTLRVKPSPQLDLTYFLQRDVMGDDALTETVEPSVPAEFALVLNNKGYGDATKLKMATQAPQIVDNEKGLVLNFDLLGSSLNGVDKSLPIGGGVVTDFGTVPARSQAYAQWWMQSSLLGHFTDYDASVTHLTSYGNEELSLVDEVSIHELVHGFTPYPSSYGATDVKRAFLVNDVEDDEDLPDKVYFTDATSQQVGWAASASTKKLSNNRYSLSMTPQKSGWTYGSVPDPTNGRATLVGVTRQSDGAEINVDNVWQTDRTLRDGKDPLYEYRLHFVGNIPVVGETYFLVFEPLPAVMLGVDQVIGTPVNGEILTGALTEVTVKFNKAIDPQTFTGEDISLSCQGRRLSTDEVTIVEVDSQTFLLDLTRATEGDGFYSLTIQTAGITDAEGFNGSSGKQVSWTQYGDQLTLKVVVSPEEAGTVTPSGGRYDYGSDVTLTAAPKEGYEFSGWKQGDDELSSDSTIAYHVMRHATLTALFTPKHYDVRVSYDASLGTVENGGTGIYDYGTQLRLTAMPANGSSLEGWRVNGVDMTDVKDELSLVVTGPLNIEVIFKSAPSVSPAPIPFADAEVKRICVENWDTNGDGELSYAEAAEVSDLGDVFSKNSTITNFDELAFFTSLTNIADQTFYRCRSLHSVVLPESLRTIGYRAFMECKLQSLTIPDGMQVIQGAAFADNDIQSVRIPASVGYIGNYVFAGNRQLATIVVDPENTVYDSRNGCNAIINTSSNELIQGSMNTVIPAGIVGLADGAFEFVEIETLILPQGLERIGMNVFWGCRKLKEIALPEGLISIGRYSFTNCVSLKEFHIPQSVSFVDGSAIAGCDEITAISVADGNANYCSVEGSNAVTNKDGTVLVMGCSTTVIPSTVRVIANECFRERRKLLSIEIPEGVEYIEEYAFCECSALGSIVIPKSVATIGDYAFSSCTRLRTVTVMRPNPISITNSVFSCQDESILYVPFGCKTAYEAAEYWKDFKEIVEMPVIATVTLDLAKGWNWVSSCLQEPLSLESFSEFCSRIVGQTQELIRDPSLGMTGGLTVLEVDKGYKVLADEEKSLTVTGVVRAIDGATIDVRQGWNWVGYPYPQMGDVAVITNAEEGDFIVSQKEFTEYTDGEWTGSLTVLAPGEGYLYKSVGDKTLKYAPMATDSRLFHFTQRHDVKLSSAERHCEELSHAYPSTMSITARLCQDGHPVEWGDNPPRLYAIADGELRGIGVVVGDIYYLTVYGDRPVEINFVVEDAVHGEQTTAMESLSFRDDVVGSHRQPFVINVGSPTGIREQTQGSHSHGIVYDMQGRKVNGRRTAVNSRLRKGVYIYEGRKVVK